MRIGQMLVTAGLLDADQVEAILRKQQSHPEPFGLLAQRLYGIDPATIETIWAESMIRISEIVRPDVSGIDPALLDLITRRQAWQFRFLPISIDHCGTLKAATTREHLSRAVRFATRVLDRPCSFVLTDSEFLAEQLDVHYALPGLDERAIEETQLQEAIRFSEDVA
jgi:hypothetical protein